MGLQINKILRQLTKVNSAHQISKINCLGGGFYAPFLKIYRDTKDPSLPVSYVFNLRNGSVSVRTLLVSISLPWKPFIFLLVIKKIAVNVLK